MAIGYGWCTNGEIDELNILNATKKAFRQAYFAMEHDCSHVLIDAVKGLDIPAEQHSIIHGDALSYLIGAASIAAKVKGIRICAKWPKSIPNIVLSGTRAMVRRSILPR